VCSIGKLEIKFSMTRLQSSLVKDLYAYIIMPPRRKRKLNTDHLVPQSEIKKASIELTLPEVEQSDSKENVLMKSEVIDVVVI